MELETKEHQFNMGNFLLVLGVAIILIILAIFQKPFRLKSKADSLTLTPGVVTIASNTNTSRSDSKQAVLGAVTYNRDLINQFSNLQVNTISDNSDIAIQNYAEQVSVVFQNDHPNDNQPSHELKFANDLKEISAPNSLQDYQRLILAYY